MIIPTCYRCPMRLTAAPTEINPFKTIRCSKLQGKLDAVKGASLTSISFRCEIRESLYGPGEVVTFDLWFVDEYLRDGGSHQECTGIVMRTKGRKLLVYCEQSERNPIWIRDDAKKTHVKVPVCIHCGLPIGVERPVMKEGAIWSCRPEYTDEGIEELPCEAAS